jgi:hypothetical protein
MRAVEEIAGDFLALDHNFACIGQFHLGSHSSPTISTTS